ncbi:RICIN domain-containing protein [Paractinoplanes tereljensis]|uniref:RICIN domain-containing protein n=1 Tax=Paractinoplanes tereljensis TaxID=571912 RepID=UPI00339B4CE4
MQTGTCLYAPDSGGGLELWACTGTDPQKFDLPSDGTLRVRDRCVQVADDGAALQLATCSGSARQQFALNAAYDLVNVSVDRCVEVPGGDSGNGVPARIATCTGAGSQKWRY